MQTGMNRRGASAGSTLKVGALVLFAGTSLAMGQGTLVPIPPHSSTYNGFSRGYNFTANTPFLLSRLELPPEAMQAGDTAGFLVRINGATALRSVGHTTAHIDPMIFINTGDVVDIIGNWSPAATGNFTAHNSYASSGVINTTIEGVAHELRRTGWQWDIGDPNWESGSYLSPGTGQPGRIFMYSLPPNTDPGGCCLPDGTCQIVTPIDCANQGGAFRGPNTDCVDPCPQPGACCYPDGSCDFILEAACASGGGTYAGAGVTCVAANCPQPPTGACCLSDGTCTIVWEPGCLAQGGLYQGDGTDCAAVVCPLSLTTAYDGTLSATAANAGAFFDITALNAAGIVVDGFQMNSPASAGTAMTVQVWVKPGSYVGSEQNQSLWTMLGEAQTIAAGLGERTPVPVGDLHIAEGETWGVRMTALNGGHRYNNTATTVPIHNNSDIQIELGAVQNNSWGSVLSGIRGWNGTVFYTVGATVEVGACCFVDGTCNELSDAVCGATGGVFQGANTDCLTANCPQPGACCLPSGCFVYSEGECLAFGGDYQGNGTDCGTANCPPPSVGNIVGFNVTTSSSTTLDPQNWNRISSATGTLFNVPDDMGLPTTVNIEWSGSSGGFSLLGTSILAPDAVPQFTYDLSGMTGYGYRSGSAPFTIELSGLSPNTEYEYWFVAYRAAGLIENLVQVSLGDTLNAISFPQSITSAQNNGRFIVNDTIADDTMHWDALANTTTSSSNGTMTFNWAGVGQTTVIGALAIREILAPVCYPNCDGSTVVPILNVDDFTCFINEFAAAQSLPHEQQVTHYSNCDGSTIAPVLNVDDFTCFINEFAAGCR